MLRPANLLTLKSTKQSTRPFVLFVGLILALQLMISSYCYSAELQNIEVLSTDSATQVVLQLDEKVYYIQNSLPASGKRADRCYVDLYSTSRSHTLPSSIEVEKGHIAKIRTGIQATTLRVVLDLNEQSDCTLSTLDDPFRMVLTVSRPERIEKPVPVPSPIASTKDTDEPTLPVAPTQPPTETSDIGTETESATARFLTQEDNNIETWGWVQLYTAQDTEEQKAEDHRFSRFRSRLGADWETDLSSDYSLQVRGSIDIDHIFYEQSMADDKTEIRFAETYIYLSDSNWDISLGRQRVRWGKSDQFSPIDSINPQDFRQFITVELEERAISSWLLRTRWYGDSISLETVVQPWFEESKFEYFDSDWALYRNFRKAITSAPLLSEVLKSYVRAIQVKEDKPSYTPENMSAAIRFGWQTEQADFAVSYNYSWETMPTINSFPIKNIDYSGDPSDNPLQGVAPADFTNESVEAEYKRQQTVGFEWETVIDLIGFRGEIAYKDNVALLSSDLTSERNPVIHLVSGVDYTSESGWYFNVQGSWYHIQDFTGNILYYDKNTVSALGEVRKPILRGKLEFAAKYIYTISDGSSYVQPSITIKYFENVECEAGASVFSGTGDTMFGSYDKADQVYAILKYSF